VNRPEVLVAVCTLVPRTATETLSNAILSSVRVTVPVTIPVA
jgi:hypothetical protein